MLFRLLVFFALAFPGLSFAGTYVFQGQGNILTHQVVNGVKRCTSTSNYSVLTTIWGSNSWKFATSAKYCGVTTGYKEVSYTSGMSFTCCAYDNKSGRICNMQYTGVTCPLPVPSECKTIPTTCKNVSDLQSRVSSAEKAITDAATNIAAFKASNHTDLLTVNSSLNSIKTYTDGLESALGSIKTYTDGLEGNTSLTNTKLTALDASLRDIKSYTDGIESLTNVGNSSLAFLVGQTDSLEGNTVGIYNTQLETNRLLNASGATLRDVQSDTTALNEKLAVSNSLAGDRNAKIQTTNDKLDGVNSNLSAQGLVIKDRLDSANVNLSDIESLLASNNAKTQSTNDKLDGVNSNLVSNQLATNGVSQHVDYAASNISGAVSASGASTVAAINDLKEAVGNISSGGASYDLISPTMPGVAAAAARFKASWDNFSSAPIVSAGAAVFQSFPSGSGDCPVLSGDIPTIGHVSTDIHCSLLSSFSSYISAFMLAFWSLMAVFVFRRG